MKLAIPVLAAVLLLVSYVECKFPWSKHKDFYDKMKPEDREAQIEAVRNYYKGRQHPAPNNKRMPSAFNHQDIGSPTKKDRFGPQMAKMDGVIKEEFSHFGARVAGEKDVN